MTRSLLSAGSSSDCVALTSPMRIPVYAHGFEGGLAASMRALHTPDASSPSLKNHWVVISIFD